MKFCSILVFFILLTIMFYPQNGIAENAGDAIKIYGKINAVNNQFVELDKGGKDGVTKNSKGNIYIKKSGTNEITYLCKIEVTEVKEKTSVAKIINSKGKIEKEYLFIVSGIKPLPPAAMLPMPGNIIKPSSIGFNAEAQIIEIKPLSEKPEGNNIDPLWTPQGDRVYFVSNRNNDYWNIYTIKTDGTDIVKITSDTRRNYSPHMSKNGQNIVFVSSRHQHEDIYTMKFNGTDVKRLTEKLNLSNDNPKWSPDGKKIAFVSFSGNPKSPKADIYLINADGTGLTTLTNTGDNFAPDWSPDGKKMLIVSSRTGHEEIYTLNLANNEFKQITQLKAEIGAPRWSPDGTKIVFMINKDHKSSHICIMSADGTKLQEMTTKEWPYNYVPSWSPDGKNIIYVASKKNVQNIYIMKLKWNK